MTNKTLLDFQTDWERIVEKGFATYPALTLDERLWFNIGVLIGTVASGGIIGHYCNYGAENNQETIDDLNTFGFDDLSKMLLQVNKLFPNERPSKDMMERNEIISNWPEFQYDDLFEQLDDQFSKRIPMLEEKLIEYIIAKNLSS